MSCLVREAKPRYRADFESVHEVLQGEALELSSAQEGVDVLEDEPLVVLAWFAVSPESVWYDSLDDCLAERRDARCWCCQVCDIGRHLSIIEEGSGFILARSARFS